MLPEAGDRPAVGGAGRSLQRPGKKSGNTHPTCLSYWETLIGGSKARGQGSLLRSVEASLLGHKTGQRRVGRASGVR